MEKLGTFFASIFSIRRVRKFVGWAGLALITLSLITVISGSKTLLIIMLIATLIAFSAGFYLSIQLLKNPQEMRIHSLINSRIFRINQDSAVKNIKTLAYILLALCPLIVITALVNLWRLFQ